MRLVLLIFVGPMVAAAVVLGAVAVVGLRPVTTRPAGLAWDGRTFTTEAQFRGWLRSHGLSYRGWLARHPGAAPWERHRATVRRLEPEKRGKSINVLSPAARIIAASLLGLLGLGIAVRRMVRRLARRARRLPRREVAAGRRTIGRIGRAAHAAAAFPGRRRRGELGRVRRGEIAVYVAASVVTFAVGAAIPLLLR